MKKLFCMTDIHSFYEEMYDALVDEAGFDINNPNHIFVHCGDLLDRGPDSLKCLQFVNSIPENRKLLVKGNHEDLLQDAIARGFFMQHDAHNCTVDTVAQLSDFSKQDLYYELTAFAALDKCSNNEELKKYYDSLVDYKEVGKYIFVHGWIPTTYKCGMPIYNWEQGFWVDGDWKEARWSNGMKEWIHYKLKNRTIVCGHFHTSWGHSHLHNFGTEFDDDYYFYRTSLDCHAHFEPFIDEGIIALDSCVAYSGKLYCEVLEIEDYEWQ